MSESLEAKQRSREKSLVAGSSVLAAVFLTGGKLTIGLLTGSLGILSEAAHSGLDLVAAVITFYSVRISDRPPDEPHHYGHGKVENFSALAETMLLFVTCAWIIYEAVERLFIRPVHVEVTIWSFLVMAVSIAIDLTRSRALMRTAKKYSSQALEADALHFSTDVWSSSVVIAGLVAVFVARTFLSSTSAAAIWLSRADAIAALGVSGIVLLVSYRLGRRTIGVLLDTAPKGMARNIREIVKKHGEILIVDRVRVRQSGAATFVDLTVGVSSSKSFEESHELTRQLEGDIRTIAPGSDVMVHVEPVGDNNKSLVGRVQSTARKHGLNVHDVYLNSVEGKKSLEVHAEVPEDINVGEAHGRVTNLEQELLREFTDVKDVIVHIDPVGDASLRRPSGIPVISGVRDRILEAVRQVSGIQSCHNITVLREKGKLVTSFHCTVPAGVPVTEAHEMTGQIESLLRERFPAMERVTIHLEPCDDDCPECKADCLHRRAA